MSGASGIEQPKCRRCGFQIWMVRASPAAAKQLGQPGGTMLFLEPHEADGGGVRVVDGVGYLVGRTGEGRHELHRCPERIVTCKYCGERVRVMAQPLGREERLAVVNAEPASDGIIVVVDGFAVRDPNFDLPGPRYRWHSDHGRSKPRSS